MVQLNKDSADTMSPTLVNKQIYLAVSQLLTGLLSLVTTIYLTRILEIEVYGALGAVISSCLIIYFFQSFGLNAAIVNTTLRRSKSLTFNNIATIIQLRGMVSIFTFFIIAVSHDFIAQTFNIPDDLKVFLVIYGLTLCLLEISTTINVSLVALDDTKNASLSRAVLQGFTAVITILASFFFGVTGYFCGLLGGAVVYLCSQVLLIFWHTRSAEVVMQRPSPGKYVASFKSIYLTSKTSYFTKLIYGIWFRAPVLVFAVLEMPQISAALFVSLQLVEKMRSIATSVSPANTAHMNQLLLEERDSFVMEAEKNLRRLLFIVCVAFVGGIGCSQLFFGLLFDAQYEGAHRYFSLLTVASFAFVYINYVGSSILYPLKKIEKLPLFHLLTKLPAFMLFSLVSAFIGPLYGLVIYAVVDFLAIDYYLRMARDALNNQDFLRGGGTVWMVLALAVASIFSLVWPAS